MVDRLHNELRFVCAAFVLLLSCVTAPGQPEPAQVEAQNNNHVGTISELRDKQRALLLVFKAKVIAVDDADKAIIDDVLKAHPAPKGRYAWVYNDLARRLNKYMSKYGSVSAARDLTDAEYVIFFNVVEFRRILNAIYPYGELYVIVKGSPRESKPPRIVWRAKKMLIAEDAMKDLIRDLKALRGEI